MSETEEFNFFVLFPIMREKRNAKNHDWDWPKLIALSLGTPESWFRFRLVLDSKHWNWMKSKIRKCGAAQMFNEKLKFDFWSDDQFSRLPKSASLGILRGGRRLATAKWSERKRVNREVIAEKNRFKSLPRKIQCAEWAPEIIDWQKQTGNHLRR